MVEHVVEQWGDLDKLPHHHNHTCVYTCLFMNRSFPAALRENGVKGVMYDRSFVSTVLALVGQHCSDVSNPCVFSPNLAIFGLLLIIHGN